MQFGVFCVIFGKRLSLSSRAESEFHCGKCRLSAGVLAGLVNTVVCHPSYLLPRWLARYGIEAAW